MNVRSRAALEIWHARRSHTAGDHAFAVYLALMVVLVALVPLARLVWLSATGAEGIAMLTAPQAPLVVSLVVGMLWGGALILGRDRGPALLAPFPTHVFAHSGLRGVDAFGRPVLRALVAVTIGTTAVAAFIGAALAGQGSATPIEVAGFSLAGGLAGLCTTVLWLVGQVFPRAAVIGAGTIIILTLAGLALPALLPFVPSAWVGLSYPPAGSTTGIAALSALTLASVAVIPALLNRLRPDELAVQAARWDAVAVHAFGMEFSAAAATYQPRPAVGRRLRAVHPHAGLARTFLVRDAIGAVRTPGRLIVGISALVASAALLTFALLPGTPGWLLGAIAGLVAFGGLGPLTDGLRHAMSAAADLSPYGVSDLALLALHALFPLIVSLSILLAVAGVCALLLSTPVLPALVSTLALALLTLGIRLSSALKGPLPTALLTPMSTPAGDPMAAVRMAWALDAVLLAALVGGAAAVAGQTPPLLLALVGIVPALVTARWRARH